MRLRSNAFVLLLAATAVCAAAWPAAAASVDGINLHWASTGAGSRTLVLIHGWTCDDTSWSAQVPALSKKYRVLTLDLPGHGKSGMPKDGGFSMDLFGRQQHCLSPNRCADPAVRRHARRSSTTRFPVRATS